MDKLERERLKTLATDAVVDLFGIESRESQLATALEKCVEELEDTNAKCAHCSTCENHGDFTDDSVPIEASDVMGVHSELKKLLQRLKEYHVKLSGEVANDWADPDQLTNPLAEIIEETESQIDELEALVIT